MRKSKRPKPTCPNCKSSRPVIPIAYGMPPPDIMEKATKGKVVIGGCCLFGNDPNWYCKKCEKEWKSDNTNPYGF